MHLFLPKLSLMKGHHSKINTPLFFSIEPLVFFLALFTGTCGLKNLHKKFDLSLLCPRHLKVVTCL